MGAKEELLSSLVAKDTSGGIQLIHDKLVRHELKWKGPSNSQTLLYFFRKNGKEIGVAAMRQGIFSFPAPFWRTRDTFLREALNRVASYSLIGTEPAISSSQYSAGQIRINQSTIDSIESIIEEIILPESRAAGATIT
ncbi:hypothetical protein [Shewanella colwelliana]|uniref:hypothetical protein n=1 Tax=Shewanella colwelliana TaxID=23 RepID=UPI00048AF5EB|nr:hypothetical protein [Shewanella colwelliana]